MPIRKLRVDEQLPDDEEVGHYLFANISGEEIKTFVQFGKQHQRIVPVRSRTNSGPVITAQEADWR